MKGNYRMTWDRGYHWCHLRGGAEGYFAAVVLFPEEHECWRGGVLATKALVPALVLGEMQRSSLSLSVLS